MISPPAPVADPQVKGEPAEDDSWEKEPIGKGYGVNCTPKIHTLKSQAPWAVTSWPVHGGVPQEADVNSQSPPHINKALSRGRVAGRRKACIGPRSALTCVICLVLSPSLPHL